MEPKRKRRESRPKVRLTAERIRKLEDAQKDDQYFIGDTEVQGFRVRVAGPRKTFVFETSSKIGGRKIPRMKIGACDAWSVEDARAEARRLQVLIDRGIDPREARSAEQREALAAQEEAERLARLAAEAEQRRQITLATAWSAYLEARKPHWSERHHRDHISVARPGGEQKKRGTGTTEPGPLAALADERLCELSAGRLASWLQSEAARRPAQTRLAFGLLQTFAGWCNGQSDYRALIDLTIFQDRSVRDALPAKRAKTDVLQREQLEPWFAAVRKLDNPVISAYLQTVLLTGARREEIATLTWENVDFQWGSLRIRDKVEGERIIPLTPYVSSLFAALPRRNQWVFSSPASKTTGRLREPRIAHNRALAAAGLPPITLHGLRRSFGTLSEWVEMPVGIVAQIMGHKPSALAERHYRRRPIDLLRQWHTKLETWMLDEAGLERPSTTSAERLRRVK